jgi:hypothetical protein
MSYGQPNPPKVRKHLMTPGQTRPQRPEPMSLGRVQRWVLSVLAATTIMHLSAGLVLAAVFSDKESSRIGLLVIAGAFGLLAIAAARLIHKRNPLSAWLLLGLVPAGVGAYFVFR